MARERPQDLRNNVVMNSSGLLFASGIPDMKLRKPATWNTKGYRKKNPEKSQKTKKGQPNKTKPLDNKSSAPAKH